MTEVYTATNRTPDVCTLATIIINPEGKSYFVTKTGNRIDLTLWKLGPALNASNGRTVQTLDTLREWARNFARDYGFERVEG